MAIGDQNIWYPGLDYKGREGDYAQPCVGTFPQEMVIELVRKRAQEDYAWVMANGMASDSEERMSKMLVWVSDYKHIHQCLTANPDETIDWVCRELGKITHQLGRPHV